MRQLAYNMLTASFFRPRAPVRGKAWKPPKMLFADDIAEIEFYARDAFTAFEYALEHDRPHPKLWKRIQGSAFELPYLQHFGSPH